MRNRRKMPFLYGNPHWKIIICPFFLHNDRGTDVGRTDELVVCVFSRSVPNYKKQAFKRYERLFCYLGVVLRRFGEHGFKLCFRHTGGCRADDTDDIHADLGKITVLRHGDAGNGNLNGHFLIIPSADAHACLFADTCAVTGAFVHGFDLFCSGDNTFVRDKPFVHVGESVAFGKGDVYVITGRCLGIHIDHGCFRCVIERFFIKYFGGSSLQCSNLCVRQEFPIVRLGKRHFRK